MLGIFGDKHFVSSRLFLLFYSENTQNNTMNIPLLFKVGPKLFKPKDLCFSRTQDFQTYQTCQAELKRQLFNMSNKFIHFEFGENVIWI